MMAVLMGVLAATGLDDISVVGAVPAWTGLGLALQAAVTEELWMRALLLRLGGSILVSTGRPGAETWLTGGTFGPEAPVFALLLVTAVTGAALRSARKAGRFATRPHLPDPAGAVDGSGS